MIQFFHNGNEYTTRTRLEAKYKIAHSTLESILNDKRLERQKDSNKVYYLKVQVENTIEAYIQQRLIAKAAKKKHVLPVPKFEKLSFDDYHAQ